MTRHLFLTARSQPIPRWTEAFPDARIICGDALSGVGPQMLEAAAIVWLHLTANGTPGPIWVEAVRTVSASVPIVVLSNVPEDDEGLAVLATGANGYSSALTLPAVLRQVASVVENGGVWMGPQLMRRFIQSLAAAQAPGASDLALRRLSQRERQVAEATARGATNKEIARVMGITERTVKAHLSASYEKLGVRDRMQLALVVNGVDNSPPIPTKRRA